MEVVAPYEVLVEEVGARGQPKPDLHSVPGRQEELLLEEPSRGVPWFSAHGPTQSPEQVVVPFSHQTVIDGHLRGTRPTTGEDGGFSCGSSDSTESFLVNFSEKEGWVVMLKSVW